MKKSPTISYYFIFAISYFSLLIERLWDRFWISFTILTFFAALSLLNIPSYFGVLPHTLILILFSIAFILSLFYTKISFSAPSKKEVKRHIERASNIKHRPLEMLKDKPITTPSENAKALWHKQIEKTARTLYTNLKIYTPRPKVSYYDKLSLRQLAIISFAIGLIAAQGDARTRLQENFTPEIATLINAEESVFDLWITYPEYTEKPATFLATKKQGIVYTGDTIQAPENSSLKLRMTGYKFSPTLIYAGKEYPLIKLTAQTWILDLPLKESGTLKLDTFFKNLGKWSINTVADAKPNIEVIKAETTPQSALQITYKVQDDYKLKKVLASISLESKDLKKPLGDEIQFRISETSFSNEEQKHTKDLTNHPWAGMAANLVLEVEDAVGNKKKTAPFPFTLPERRFTNPLAKQLIKARKKIIWAQDSADNLEIVKIVASIAGQPYLYKYDTRLFLALAVAAKRLMYKNIEDNNSIQNLLWNAALKLEDGGLSLARKELQDTLQKLSSSLNDKNTSRQELNDLSEAVQKKMMQYVRALSMELQQRLQQNKTLPVLSPEIANKFMKNIDINKMLKQISDFSEINSREDLQRITDSLNNAIENLDLEKIDQMQEEQLKAIEALQKLEEIIHNQQSLFDKTNKTKGLSKLKELTEAQASLRQDLGQMIAKIGEVVTAIPDNFAKANQSMRESEGRFIEQKPKESLPHQKIVLDELQKAMDKATQQMAEMMQQSILSFGLIPNGGNFGEGFDPLGRSKNKERINIPNKEELRRVQKIIKELRQRSNERNRIQVERDYLDRLLDLF